MRAARPTFFRYLAEAPLLWCAIFVLACLIFIADTVTKREIAFAVLHVVVILMAVRTGRVGAILAVAVGCVALTVTSYALTPHGSQEAGLANAALSLLAIGASTWLAMRLERLQAASRRAQGELARMSRIVLMGELSASIAHEVSQPVTAIAAHGHAALRWLSASPPNEHEARQALRRIVGDAERAGEVVARVRRLVARAEPRHEPLDLSETVAEALALMRGELRRHDIALRTELADDLPAVSGDRVQLQQIVLNFVLNAADAMAETPADVRDLLVSTAANGASVTVSVRDTGSGVSAEAQSRLFEAFFSTKAHGMGMGLAISRSIVEAHGGQIYAAPNYPTGADFGFTLPAAAKPTPDPTDDDAHGGHDRQAPGTGQALQKAEAR
ncbi:serine/threonine protein kinase [Xaviernesmea oryzae]|uniref:histidine kinase n=1 Tax=Xaviernesmea oryzae TaxID=464029 RepID=A0A1Q9AR11_9HYPH|nr:ATP-binding protein [Xaviernesmea oryzae]OLP57850.1 serine/threonine protein kinase [Xaviernesmea oryzae]SEL34170.1 His Kinase A (phospho-acceptor) domain-containing protein [Xaviernesmea oryzae]